MKPIVLFVVGPTASGKTDAAVYAAKELGGEVISADAIQIYRQLNKGSAKPTPDEMQGIPHHLINVVDYTCGEYNVAAFSRDATKCIDDIVSRGMIPIVAGGTGLYVNSLLYPLDFTEVKPDKDIRDRLDFIENSSPGALYERLKQVDPVSAGRLHPNDRKRIIRALEVYESTGKTITDMGGDFLNEKGEELTLIPVIAGLNMDRAKLYARIDRRVDVMLENGLMEEALSLFGQCGAEPPLSLQAIGYKQFGAYIDGLVTYDETVALIKRETRRFAKRQISWFKRDKRIRWFDTDEYSSRMELHKAVAAYFKEEMNRIEHR